MSVVDLWKFYSWLSRSDSQWKRGSFIYWERIDNINLDSAITLSKKPTRIYNWTERITQILECFKETNVRPILLFGYDWHVWDSSDTTSPIYYLQDWVDRVEWGWNTYWNIQYYKFVAYDWEDVNYIAPALKENDDWSEILDEENDVLYKNNTDMTRVNDTIWDWATNIWGKTRTYNGILSLWDSHYIWWWTTIHVVDWVTWTMTFAYFPTKKVVGITYIGGQFRVYQTDWVMYLWDGKVSDYRLQVYNLGVDVQKVWQMLNMDYFISWNGLYYVESITWKPIYRKVQSSYIDDLKFNFFMPVSWKITTSNGLICLVEEKIDWWKKICVFGQKIAGNPMSYTVIDTPSNYEDIYYIEGTYEGFYISYKDIDWSYGVDFYDMSIDNDWGVYDDWYVVTLEYKKNYLSEKKKWNKIYIYCENIDETSNIKIEYSINKWDFEELETLNNTTNIKNGLYIITNMNKEFHRIVFKLTLINWDSKTPILNDFLFEHE